MTRDNKKYLSSYIPEVQKETKKRGKTENQSRISDIEESIKAIQDSIAKSNRDNLDSIYNIDTDNLSSSLRRLFASYEDGITKAEASINTIANEQEAGFEAIAKWQKTVEDGTISSISGISAKANANAASISSITKWQSTTDSAITSINQTASNQASKIQLLTNWQSGVNQSISAIETKAGQNESKITALTNWKNSADSDIDDLIKTMAVIEAESNANGTSISQIVSAVGSNGNVTAASIVAAVNNAGSNVKINADSIDIDSAFGGLTLSASGSGEVESNIVQFLNGPDNYYGVVYGFARTSDGYYTSTNGGINDSFSYAGFLINNVSSSTSKKLILRCISYGEANYDYGVISILEKELETSTSITNDFNSGKILKSFKGQSSPDPVDVILNVPAGALTAFTFKYVKDTVSSSGGDYFKIKVIDPDASGDEESSVIGLSYNGMLLSSAEINIKGFVTFESLENDGATTINGNNVSLILDGSRDNGYTNLDSINSFTFKYRDNRGVESSMAKIYTEISGDDTYDTSRYALKLRTEAFYNNLGNPVYPAIKLLSMGRISLESMLGIYIGTEKYDGSYITLDAYETTRIATYKSFRDTDEQTGKNRGYCFCTDGIYYNGTKILST